MRRLISALVAFLFCCANAQAANRVIIYSGQQWGSAQSNTQARFYRLSSGTWMRDALGSNLTAGGVYNNVSTVPNGGMFVATQPTTSNQLGSLYQLMADDSSPVPTTQLGNQISADPTQIVVQATQGGISSSLGPLIAPASGLQQYYLIEAQVQTVDATPESLEFGSAGSSESTQTVNTQRIDQIVYQIKAGTAASSPTAPAVDTGWIAISNVLVPSGVTAITSPMITPYPPFQGFVEQGAALDVSSLTINTLTTPGCVQNNSSGQFLSAACTSGLGTVNGTSPIVANTVGGTATITCPTCITNITATGNLSSSGGTTPTLSFSSAPSFTSVTSSALTTNGSSTIPNAGTATSSTNYGSFGGFQVLNSIWNGTTPVQNIWGLSTGATNQGLNTKYNSTLYHFIDPSGNDAIPAANTATSSTNYGSLGSFQLFNSIWTTSAQSNVWGLMADAIGNLKAQYNGTTQWSVSNTGTVTATGFVGSGASLTNLPLNQFSGLTTGYCIKSSGATTEINAAGPCATTNANNNFTASQSTTGSWIAGSSFYGQTSAAVAGPLALSGATAGTASAVGLWGDAGSTPGLAFNVPSGSSNGFTFNTNGSTVASINNSGTGTFGAICGLACPSGMSPGDISTSRGNGTAFLFFGGTASHYIEFTPSSFAFTDSITAPNFFTSSRREWKKNITPYTFDALDLVTKHIDYAEYDCKTKQCGPVGMHKVGIIANDTATQVSGANHDHYDAFALAAIDGKAISELSHKVDGLEVMVRALCKQKKNRKEKACALVH